MDTSTPNGHIYLRTFGQDMFYTAFDSLNDLARQFTSIWPFSFSTFGEQNIDYDHSSIFLDGKIVIPTVAGLPLSLAVNGTSIVKVSPYVHSNPVLIHTKNFFKVVFDFLPNRYLPKLGLGFSPDLGFPAQ